VLSTYGLKTIVLSKALISLLIFSSSFQSFYSKASLFPFQLSQKQLFLMPISLTRKKKKSPAGFVGKPYRQYEMGGILICPIFGWRERERERKKKG